MTRRFVIGTTLLALFSPWVASAQSLPSARKVTYTIFNDPEDPESGIAWTLEFHLTPKDRSGDTVVWAADWLVLSQYDGENVLYTWTALSPAFETEDDMWHIDHVDADNPCDDDFKMPPLVQVTALADQTGIADMEVTWDARTPPQTPNICNVSITFLHTGEYWPIYAGEEQPVRFDMTWN